MLQSHDTFRILRIPYACLITKCFQHPWYGLVNTQFDGSTHFDHMVVPVHWLSNPGNFIVILVTWLWASPYMDFGHMTLVTWLWASHFGHMTWASPPYGLFGHMTLVTWLWASPYGLWSHDFGHMTFGYMTLSIPIWTLVTWLGSHGSAHPHMDL